jgi:hypothetical protein
VPQTRRNLKMLLQVVANFESEGIHLDGESWQEWLIPGELRDASGRIATRVNPAWMNAIGVPLSPLPLCLDNLFQEATRTGITFRLSLLWCSHHHSCVLLD